MKNIIIIKTDQQRFDLLGCMGHPLLKTPHLDVLAEDGVLFNNAHCVSPLCVPSRTSFFTGNYVCKTGSVSNAMDHHIHQDPGCLLDTLKDVGYRLALVGKNHAFDHDYLKAHFCCHEEYENWGKKHGTIRESDQRVATWLQTEDRFPDGPNREHGKLEGLFEGAMPFNEDDCVTARIAEDAIDYIEGEAKDGAQPFMLHLSFPDPHWPNVVCEPYYSMYNPSEIELPAEDHDWNEKPFAHWVQSRVCGFRDYSKKEVQRIMATYFGQISSIDTAVGRVLDRVKELGLYDDCAIVFTSDHGDYAGNYGLLAKTKAFYESLIRVPLIMKIPGCPAGERRFAQLSNIDVMPTLLEGLELPVSEKVQGESFLPVLQGKADEHRSELFAEVGSPQDPPPAMSREAFVAFEEEQETSRGMFWFCDYTTRGRSMMIKKGGWKYCYYVGDCEELYHLHEDPLELTNLATNPAFNEMKQGLRNRLTDWLLTEP